MRETFQSGNTITGVKHSTHQSACVCVSERKSARAVQSGNNRQHCTVRKGAWSGVPIGSEYSRSARLSEINRASSRRLRVYKYHRQGRAHTECTQVEERFPLWRPHVQKCHFGLFCEWTQLKPVISSRFIKCNFLLLKPFISFLFERK